MNSGSTFEIDATQLRSVTEIAPKSPFFCVNRTCMRYDSLGGAKAMWYGVNIKKKTKKNSDKLRGTLESKQENIQ